MNYHSRKKWILGAIGLVSGLTAANLASAQSVTIASDSAANYGGDFDTGMNNGYGFGAWILNTPGGGHYVGSGVFGLWNNGYGSGTGSFATRAFGSTLDVGQTFSVSLQIGQLKSSLEHGGFNLEDSSGNILFSYWQQGGNNADGNYLDAAGAGTATGFAYDYQKMDAFSFTLTGLNSYTFTDLATSASFSGTLAGTISQLQMFRANLDGDPQTGGGGGTDFRFNNLQVVTAPEPSSLAFVGMGLGSLWVLIRKKSA